MSHWTGVLLVCSLVGWAASSSSPNDLLVQVILDCPDSGLPLSSCVDSRVYSYLSQMAPRDSRAVLPSSTAVLHKLEQVLTTNELRITLPEVFQEAQLVFRPGRGLDFDVEFDDENKPTSRESREARDMMKKNMLMPLLMLVKLKLKALTPMLLLVVGIKAMKALLLSKISFVLIMGFLIVQVCQKLGMAKMSMNPAAMPAEMEPTPIPMSMYGPPPTTSSYGPPNWEPSSGPYSRVYDTASSQSLAYNSYAPTPKATKS